MELTNEQESIIEATPPEGGSLLVTAFAGTGKTFTLERYAEARPRDRILYAAFNKAIQLEAERKMPMNVMSRTTHSLAYRAYGGSYRDAGLLSGGISLWAIAKLLETRNIVLANFTYEVVKSFLASPHEKISDKHLTPEIISYYDGKKVPPFIDMAKTVWDNMVSLKPRTLPMTHDGYLKLYQLSGPVLKFDYILLDEAQDTTPCVWDIMNNQKCKKVVVGDPFQAIYGWRKAIDALDLVKDAENLYLTKSFRFGPKVAKLATTLLHRFKGEEKPVRGLESLDTEIITRERPQKHTLVARGNMHIFKSVVSECEGDKTLGFVGGDYRNYRFPSVLDVYHVYNDQRDKAKEPLIKSFKTYEDLQEYAKKVHNKELENACQLVEEYGSRIPTIIKKVRDKDVGAKFSDLTYTTGHKAKGMEFPIVQIANDFASMIEAHKDHPNLKIMNSAEMNLLYVAITRGTEKLYLPPNVKNFIEMGSC